MNTTTTITTRDLSRQDSLLDSSSLMNLNVLLYGQGQMVWEVTRNLILIGVKSIGIVPPLQSNHKINHPTFEAIQKLNPECKIIFHSQVQTLQDFKRDVLPQYKICLVFNIFNKGHITEINQACHTHAPEAIGFVYGCSLGLYGNVFVDFGQEHIVKDPYKSQRTFPIMDLTKSPTKLEITTEDTSSLVRPKKSIRLKGSNLPQSLQEMTFKIAKTTFNEQKLTVMTLEVPPETDPKLFENLETRTCNHFELIIEPQKLTFQSFESSLPDPKINNNFEGPEKLDSKTLHQLFLAVLTFYEKSSKLPSVSDQPQFINCYQGDLKTLRIEKITQFLQNISFEFPPIASLFGALLANEALKISGTYVPLQQWLHFEELFCAANQNLHSQDPLHRILQPFTSSNIFPSLLSNKALKDFKIFIIGAGALGCEDLRLLAAMNAATGENGKIYVADFDTISKSNLHRQALYGPNDVGEPKSEIAAQRILDYNPQWREKIHAFNCPVDNDNIKTFPDAFWEDLDLILSAVDGVAPRHFLMLQAKKYKKAFINAGTDGVRCSTGVYLPGVSEVYTGMETQGDSTPSCTLKDHPYKIEHMMQYACDRFRELFVDEIRGIYNAIQSIQDFDLDELKSTDFDLDFEFNRTDLKNLIEKENTPDYPLIKAYTVLKGEVYDNILDTITKFPIDSVDEHGNLVWRAPRRFPTPLQLTPENPDHVNLIRFAANILAMNFGSKTYTEQDVINFMKEVPQEIFTFNSNKTEDFITHIKQLKTQITNEELTTQSITYSEFDKDDDSRFHMDFVEAFTSVRAANYGIAMTTRDKIRAFAGKITPNMIITTSFAASLTMFEVFKYSLGLESEFYRGYHCNLGYGKFLPRVLNDNSEVEFNEKVKFRPWDVIEMQGRKTVREIVQELQERFSIRVKTLANEGGYGAYYEKGSEEELLDECLEDQEGVKQALEDGSKYVWLKVEVGKKRKEVVNGDFPIVKYIPRREEEMSLKNLSMDFNSMALTQGVVPPNP